jgi:hypothetical protein
MRKSVVLGIAGIICLIALLDLNRIALGQAGSIGGTVGKTDKSASGGEDAKPSHLRISRPVPSSITVGKETGCGRVVGTWDWVFGVTRKFASNGTIPEEGGTWTCSGDNYVLKFPDGPEDRLKMSSDGSSMSGVSSKTGFIVSFTVSRRK